MAALIVAVVLAVTLGGVGLGARYLKRRSRVPTPQQFGADQADLQTFEESLAAANGGTFSLSPDGSLMWISATTARLLGFSANARTFTVREWLQRVHPEDRREVRDACLKAFGDCAPLQMSYRILHDDGSSHWVCCRSHTRRDARGLPAMRGVLLDITELKQLETELRARDERLRDAAVAADLTVWEFDVATQTYEIDYVRISGMDRWVSNTAVVTSTIQVPRAQMTASYHPDDQDQSTARINSCIEEQTPYEMELRRLGPDGQIQWFSICGRPVRASDGKTAKLRGVSQNITARKQAELQLREAEERFTRAIRGTNDGLLEVDLATLRVWMAPRVYEMLGYPTAETAPTFDSVRPLISLPDQRKIESALAEHLRTDRPFDVEIEVGAPEQRPPEQPASEHPPPEHRRWLRLRARCERALDGTPVRMSGSAQDVTELKQYQSQLVAATEAADTASRAKSEFLANMSHEIRTPMNGVMGMTDLLLDTPLSHTQRDFAETIRDSARALLTVINDILDFSKVEAGKLDLECVALDLRDTIEDVARLIALDAHPKGLEVAVDIDPAVPDLLRGDPGRVRQVLLNLAGNAVKFTSHGGIVISAQLLGREDDWAVVRVAIEDTGIGIPEDRIARLFNPFTQVDPSTTRLFGGTGLGLSIVRKLVELMGGTVGIDSQVGVGSTFWFTAKLQLPAAVAPETLLAHPAAALATRDALLLEDAMIARNRIRILVAEDNAVNQKVTRMTLERLGYRVDVCGNGLEAIRAWESRDYQIILMDCQMPEMDGYEATREIRRRERGAARIPIIALTAHAIDGALAQCLEAGMDDHLTKPIVREGLEACLNRFLGQTVATAKTTLPSLQDAAPPEPIDLQALRILLDGDVDLLRELTGDFIALGNASLATLADSLQADDRDRIAQTAHALKGASANLRANAVSSLAADLEQCARDEAAQNLRQLSGQLRDELHRAFDYLSREVA